MNHLTTHKHKESSYLRAYKAPLHLSRTLDKFTLLCKTNPILIRAKINLTIYMKKIYGNFTRLRTMKNKPNTNPIQSQFAGHSNERKFYFNKGL